MAGKSGSMHLEVLDQERSESVVWTGT